MPCFNHAGLILLAIMHLLRFVVVGASNDVNPKRTRTLRLFGKDIVPQQESLTNTSAAESLHDQRKKTRGKGPIGTPGSTHQVSLLEQRRTYTQEDANRLKFKHNSSNPKTDAELSAMTRVERARHSNPFEYRTVKRGKSKDRNGNPFYKSTSEMNIEYVNRHLKEKRKLMSLRQERYNQKQLEIARKGEPTSVRENAPSTSSENPKFVSLALLSFRERRQRAKDMGDQVMLLKTKQGVLQPDPLGRTGSQYLSQMRERKAMYKRKNRLKRNTQ